MNNGIPVCAITFCCLVLFAAATPAAEPQLDAELTKADLNAAKGNALIQVTVAGFELIDADEAGPSPRAGQGHLHYQLDGGPVIATAARKPWSNG